LKKIAPERAERWLDDFIKAAGLRIEPVTSDQAQAARSAHLRFAKGTGHAAALNFGDCVAYALAKAMGAPLLCKGNDFRLTDIGIA
jgi:ribonuclease VapC